MRASWAEVSSKHILVLTKLPILPNGDRILAWESSSPESSLSSLYDFLAADLLDFDGGGFGVNEEKPDDCLLAMTDGAWDLCWTDINI